MSKEIQLALNNLWVVVSNAKLIAREHDQLRDDFTLVREVLEVQTKKQE